MILILGKTNKIFESGWNVDGTSIEGNCKNILNFIFYDKIIEIGLLFLSKDLGKRNSISIKKEKKTVDVRERVNVVIFHSLSE